MNEKASVSIEMAYRLSKAFGSTPETWLGMQLAFDLAQSRDLERTDQGQAHRGRIATAPPPSCNMASKKALNTKNLEALGVQRLAELLIEISTGNAAAKRRLRLELAGGAGPAEVAREVRKRLADDPPVALVRRLAEPSSSCGGPGDPAQGHRRAGCQNGCRRGARLDVAFSWNWRTQFSRVATTAAEG